MNLTSLQFKTYIGIYIVMDARHFGVEIYQSNGEGREKHSGDTKKKVYIATPLFKLLWLKIVETLATQVL